MQSSTTSTINLPEILSLFVPSLEQESEKRQKLGNIEASRHIWRSQHWSTGAAQKRVGPVKREIVVVSRFISALSRAVLVVLLMLAPALILPTVDPDTAQLVVVVALLFALLTFIEYFGRYPSIVEFRFAAPYNRMKFLVLAIVVVWLSFVARGQVQPSALTLILTYFGQIIGNAVDFPFSPVRLPVLLLPSETDPQLVNAVRTSAGVAYSASLVLVLSFVVLVRLFGWPMRNGAFNVWVNLPLFDPTRGGDIVERLKRDASLNIVLGALLPFLLPAVIKAVALLFGTLAVDSPQTLIWMTTIWALLPASILVRGVALFRVAELIEEKRRRVYAKAQAEGLQEA
ncbi:hypothetical protein [Roseovarius rhodophyticola]|uniref:Uncharacterized protein n=1 Tax=Roseovarius rhodophyticola TaxID=3080827 RepID=A0ABZ2TNT3_9RHOB|nr:hypothetical protein [Roseovarius sp. W115]MDV2930161.1 hypothetical protein [Roseovarius sp. W115]